MISQVGTSVQTYTPPKPAPAQNANLATSSSGVGDKTAIEALLKVVESALDIRA